MNLKSGNFKTDEFPKLTYCTVLADHSKLCPNEKG